MKGIKCPSCGKMSLMINRLKTVTHYKCKCGKKGKLTGKAHKNISFDTYNSRWSQK